MTLWTLIYFDDDGVISHLEHFSHAPTFTPNSNNWALYQANLDGGDSVCIATRFP